MRRRSPEPPAGRPEIQFKPGLASDLLRELAPLLAGEGIDVDNIDVPDPETLQRALNRAMERHNMALFSPVGQARELRRRHLAAAAEAIADGNTGLPRESWTKPSLNPLTAPSRRSPPAPALPSACSTSGWPGTTPAPRPAWPR